MYSVVTLVFVCLSGCVFSTILTGPPFIPFCGIFCLIGTWCMFISNKSHGFTVYHSSSVTPFPLSLAFFYSVEIKSHSKMLNSGHFWPHNPVYVRCFDPSVLVFSLSLYRHPSLCILFSSHFTSYNKQQLLTFVFLPSSPWDLCLDDRRVMRVTIVWLCLWPSVTDGSQPLSGRVMCEHYWLSVLMYTPGMSVMSLLLKNRYEIKRSRDFFL